MANSKETVSSDVGTIGDVYVANEKTSFGLMTMKRELSYQMSDDPTNSMQSYFDNLESGRNDFGESREELLDEFLEAIMNLSW